MGITGRRELGMEIEKPEDRLLLQFQRWEAFLMMTKSKTDACILEDKVEGKIPSVKERETVLLDGHSHSK